MGECLVHAIFAELNQIAIHMTFKIEKFISVEGNPFFVVSKRWFLFWWDKMDVANHNNRLYYNHWVGSYHSFSSVEDARAAIQKTINDSKYPKNLGCVEIISG